MCLLYSCTSGVKKLNQTNAVNYKFFSRDILDSRDILEVLSNTAFRHNYGFLLQRVIELMALHHFWPAGKRDFFH